MLHAGVHSSLFPAPELVNAINLWHSNIITSRPTHLLIHLHIRITRQNSTKGKVFPSFVRRKFAMPTGLGLTAQRQSLVERINRMLVTFTGDNGGERWSVDI